MTPITTFYLSQFIGLKIYSPDNQAIGTVNDILVRTEPALMDDPDRPRVVALKTGTSKKPVYISFEQCSVTKLKGKPKVVCHKKKQPVRN